MTDARTAARWDHDRDMRKHEPRPTDPPTSVQVRQVCRLTAYLDELLHLGAIPAEFRAGVRSTIETTRNAFDLPALAPKESADA